jgi:hypothetical protein
MKIHNEYSTQLESGLYDRIPKAVLAAIAVSLTSVGGEELERAQKRIMWEWECLHMNGIVPQTPPREWRQKECPDAI